jgi:hypothetical protein
MVFRGWRASSGITRMGGWADMDAAKFNAIVELLRALSERELEQIMGVAKGLQAVRRTERKRRAIVARNRAQQGIEAPRPRGRQSRSRDQSLGSTGSTPAQQ